MNNLGKEGIIGKAEKKDKANLEWHEKGKFGMKNVFGLH